MSAFFFRAAALVPEVALARVETQPLGTGVGGGTQLTVEVHNRGYLPTYGLDKAKNMPWNEPLHAQLSLDGVTLDEPGRAHVAVGHLGGWGRGHGAWGQAIFYASTPGNDAQRTLRWTLRGRGSVTLRLGSPRVGWTERRVVIEG
jgi:hypothetical protein